MNNKTLKEDDQSISKLKELILLENEERRIQRITLEGGEVKEQIIECARCGNRGINKVIASHPQKYYEYIKGRQVCDENAHIYLLECPICGQVTLVSYDWNTNVFDKNGEVRLNKEVLYPRKIRSFPNTPKNIVEAYEAAQKTMYIDNSISLIAVRRVLEFICQERGSKKKNLESMIKEMVSKDILPYTLDKCSLLIRKLGNSGAHDGIDDFYVKNVDIQELMSFIETIIYYIYELPTKISNLNERYM